MVVKNVFNVDVVAKVILVVVVVVINDERVVMIVSKVRVSVLVVIRVVKVKVTF